MECPSEETLLAYAKGGLDEEADVRVGTHLEQCEACRALVQAWARFDKADNRAGEKGAELTFERGDQLGRYTILDKLGRGGVGLVLAAYDPDLDRKVALKVLRTDRGQDSDPERTQARLMREAKAMAQVVHPNVITVFDVQRIEGQVVIAMELVAGVTLREWLAEAERSWQEVLGVFVQAARGLVAAHAAGLIHRDVKPENIMLQPEGDSVRVLVTDFGLARLARGKDSRSITGELRQLDPAALSSASVSTSLFMGTPAYMAPEQIRGKRASFETDQFSFCVALYEALFGQRPFQGEDLDELNQHILDAQLEPPPRDSKVPAGLQSLVLKGMQSDPVLRHGSMVEVLEGLEQFARASARKLRLVGAGLAALLVAGALAWWALVWTVPCQGAEQHLQGLWGPDQRQAVQRVLTESPKPYAGAVWTRLNQRMGLVHDQWAAAYTQVCQATRIHGEQSEALLDRRMACLHDQLLEARALVTQLQKSSEGTAEHALQAVRALPGARACKAVELVEEGQDLPAQGPLRDEVLSVRSRLADARALLALGRWADGEGLLQRLMEEIENLSHAPTRAQVLLAWGSHLVTRTRYTRAEPILVRAFDAADQGGQDRLRCEAAAQLVSAHMGQREFAEGLTWLERGKAVLIRLDEPPELLGDLLAHQGRLLMNQAKYTEANPVFAQAEQAFSKVLDKDDPRLARVLHNWGTNLHWLGDLKGALARFEQAHRILEEAFGPEHPDTAGALFSVANVLKDLGELDRAEKRYRRSLQIRLGALGPGDLETIKTWNNLAIVLDLKKDFGAARKVYRQAVDAIDPAKDGHKEMQMSLTTNLACNAQLAGDLEGARQAFEKSLEQRLAFYGPDHPKVALAEFNLGDILIAQERYDEALVHHERSLAITRKRFDEDHLDVADSCDGLGTIHREQGRTGRAVELHTKSLGIREKKLGADSPQLAYTLILLGRALLRDGKPEQAGKHQERALRLVSGQEPDEALQAEARFRLAEAQHAVGKKEAACRLARTARDWAVGQGDAARQQREEIGEWLRRCPGNTAEKKP